MSVAFRRESDEEHLEPKFEQPIAPGPNLVTARGLAQIEAKVEALAADVAAADVDEARRASLQRDLRYWRTRRATAEVATPPADGSVGFGSTVTIRTKTGERKITIVGGDEADPAAGLIGFQAPLPRALMGTMAGEEVAFARGTVAILGVGVDDGQG